LPFSKAEKALFYMGFMGFGLRNAKKALFYWVFEQSHAKKPYFTRVFEKNAFLPYSARFH